MSGVVDFGPTAGVYARHRPGFPPGFFARLAQWGVGLPGQRVADIGTGTGVLARALARAGCVVTGVDLSEGMVAQAAASAKEDGVSVTWRVAPAEDTGLPGGAFDVVTAAQCWHWFNHPKAAAEVFRLLVPGGVAAIAHLDWLVLPGNVVAATEALVSRYNPALCPPQSPLGREGIYPPWPNHLRVAGLENVETFSFDTDLPFTHESWRGRLFASSFIGGSLSGEKVRQFDDELAALLRERFPEPLAAAHRVFVVMGRKPATA